MNFLSKKLTEYILEKGIIEKYNYEIYQYGFQIFLELSLNILCSIIIAVILDMKIECIFSSFFYSLAFLQWRTPYGSLFIMFSAVMYNSGTHIINCKALYVRSNIFISSICHICFYNYNNRTYQPPKQRGQLGRKYPI